MPEPAIEVADLFRVRGRFLRSAHLERDFQDPAALNGYVVTEQATDYLRRISDGLAPESGQRAWRITGDYGVGKSSFALVLAHLLAGRGKKLQQGILGAATLGNRRAKLLPLLVTGSREPVSTAILSALLHSCEHLHTKGRRPALLSRLRELVASAPLSQDRDAISAIEEGGRFIRDNGYGSGILLVLDELGKFLEYAAARPDQQDVYFLQQLAESAARSGDTPLVVVGLLHQGFSAYADRLSESAQREWQKIAGRFEELIFDRPLHETARLVADAIDLDWERIPLRSRQQARRDMIGTTGFGWYGPGRHAALPGIAERLYPLHPTVLPVLTKLLARFGQNERSLFSFMLSSEPHGLQAFSHQKIGTAGFYRIHNLYDYARATLGQRLSVQSYRSHWNLIESVVESFPAEHEVELQVLKTVAMLNLIDDQGVFATTESIPMAIESSGSGRQQVVDAIAKLHQKRVLYLRGTAGGYCLWPYTSVNIERAYTEALKAVAQIGRVASVVAREVDTRPLVARRHYIETGNLRHFDVRCISQGQLEEELSSISASAADGVVLLPLCETEQERTLALNFAQSKQLRALPNVLIAVPRPLEMLRSMALEAERWHWVETHTPELSHDKYAAEEVSRQLSAAREVLRNRIQDLVGLRTLSERSEMDWFAQGKPLSLASSRDLLAKLSRICDRVYNLAPRVRNELLNRRQLSSAAAAARMRLIERAFVSSAEPLLGLDQAKAPPEMSMYLSVLRSGRLHVERDGLFVLTEPTSTDDPLSLYPTFARMQEILREVPDARVSALRLRDELARPPFGVREGLFPLLLAVFAAVHESELAFYEDGNFVPRIEGAAFMRLSKDLGSFELQHCRITGVRAEIFVQLAKVLKLNTKSNRTAHMVEVVRSLCTFAAQLPQYTHTTVRVSTEASGIRRALVAAREPALLMFRDLPIACGLPPFPADGAVGDEAVQRFVQTLRSVLDELRLNYGHLLDGLRRSLISAFDHADAFDTLRPHLAHAANALLPGVHDQRLRGFCLRLSDGALPELEWLEALGAFVIGKRPADWSDMEADRFPFELQRLAQLFRRVEAAAFERRACDGTFAARLAVTLHDGSDVARVVHLGPEDEGLASELEGQIQAILTRSPRVGLAAASRVLLRELNSSVERSTPATDGHREH